MNNLLLTDQNRRELEALAKDPPHALLLVGPAGLGKRFVAQTWAATIAPFTEIIEPDDKGTIGIDTVRSLYQRTRSKQDNRQVIIIHRADAMGIEAQNAYLKLLEEPRPGVTFVLTTHSTEALLPTITSRLQTVQLHPVASTALQAWAQQHKKLSAQDLTQLLFVAQGRPGVTATMLADDDAFEHHRQMMRRAKELLGATPFDRLAAINDLTKDKLDLIATLEAMAHMVRLQLAAGNTALLGLAEPLETCLSALAQNGNPRAQLTRLFTSY